MKLRPPKEVLEIIRRLESSGHEAWCVGGAVRDAMLGETHLDWDIATSARPEEVRKLFRRTIPLGIEFGTVGVLDPKGLLHEVTTFRRDVETDGRHARVIFGVSLDDDLARRDFTINAIAYSPSRDELHDPFDGRGDIAARLVRTVGNPSDRMAEDRLRALRGMRFASRFDFTIADSTWEAICSSAPHLGRLSPERVRQELEKTMEQVLRPSVAFVMWRNSGALAALVPSLRGVSELELSVIDHLPRPVLPRRPGRRINRMTALLRHVGGKSVPRVLRELRFSNTDSAWIAGQIERWESLAPELEIAVSAGLPVEAGFRRGWIARAGRTRTAPLLRLVQAEWCARRAAGDSAPPGSALRSEYRHFLRSAYGDPVEIGDLAVDGDDLRSAGVTPGPRMGEILHRLLAKVLEDPSLNTRGTLLTIVAELLQKSPTKTSGRGANGQGDIGEQNLNRDD